MAFSFGFYNAINNDRMYNALHMARIFDGIIKDGIYMHIGGQFIIKASPEENTILVSSGRAWFNHTWNYNDAELPLIGDPPELILDRIDAVVLDIQSGDDFRTNELRWVMGEPATNPARPNLIQDDENLHWQYPLAYIKRKALETIIHQEDITNMVGSSESPFVTGVLETMDIGPLLLQWQDQWAQFVKNYEETALNWTNEQKEDFVKFYTEFKQQLKEFETESEREFTNWFERIREILNDSVAGNLLNLIDDLDEKEFNHYYGLTNSTTEINNATNTIVTTTSESVSTTTFQNQNGKDTIQTVIVPVEGSFQYIRTTEIVNTETGNQITTSYTRTIKGA